MGGGASGLAAARRLRPALLRLDMQLPDMGGLEVLRRLRADPATAGLRCISLSADARPEDIALARAAGMADYWTKPQAPVAGDMEGKGNRWLRLARRWKALEESTPTVRNGPTADRRLAVLSSNGRHARLQRAAALLQPSESSRMLAAQAIA